MHTRFLSLRQRDTLDALCRRVAPGLYVAADSLLSAEPGVNPQEMIMAVATVIARGIVERHLKG